MDPLTIEVVELVVVNLAKYGKEPVVDIIIISTFMIHSEFKANA